MAFLGGLFKSKPGGTFVGNLFRSAIKAVPIVGGAIGTVADAAFAKNQQKLADKAASEAIAQSPPTVENVMNPAGFPMQSTVFPQGQANNPIPLDNVGITAQKSSAPVSTDIDVDWKRGRVQFGSQTGRQDNSVLLYALLVLGGLTLLKQR